MRIIYLDLDTLRPDHLGCYGYHRDTSPNLDRIAREGVRFGEYYCSDSPCQPSRTALMTGRFGIHTGVITHGGVAADIRTEGPKRGFTSRLDRETLPGFLKTQGLKTALISPFAERHGAWSFYAGFDEMFNTGKQGMESAEEVYPVAEEWFRRNAKSDNWYLHLNFWDAHVPYRAPESFGNPFADQPLPEWMTEERVKEMAERIGWMMPTEKAIAFGGYKEGGRRARTVAETYLPAYPRNPDSLDTLAGARAMIDGYDCGIRYMDEYLGRLFALLEEEGVWDDVAIIASADHGENMGELGIYGDHITADAITHRIPMIIRWPGKVSPSRIGGENTGLHYGLDLAPTIAELLGAEPPEVWDGESFAYALRDPESGGTATGAPGSARKPDPVTGGRSELIFGQAAGTVQRGVRFDNWMYVRTYHDGWNVLPKEMLFDLDADPYELTNLAEERPDICREAVYRLTNWHDEMMATMPEGYTTDPLWTVIAEGGPAHSRHALPTFLKRLEDRGDGTAFAEATRRWQTY